MNDAQLIAGVGQRSGYYIGEAEPQCALAQYDETAVRGEIARVLHGCE